MENNALTLTKGNQLALSAPVPGLSVLEEKAVIAWETPRLADRMKSQPEETEKGLIGIISLRLQEAVRRSGVGVKLEANDLQLIAKDIIAVCGEFPRLRMGEISLIFELGAVGRFGDFAGHGLNARTFRTWVLEFEKQTRSELLIRQVDAMKAETEKADQERAEFNARLYDLVSVDHLLGKFLEGCNALKMRPDGVVTYQDIDPRIDVGNIWFRKFKEANLLERLVPLTNDEKKEIFAKQMEGVKVEAWGQRRSSDDMKAEARTKSEAVWFRMVIARIITLGNSVEDFEGMLIEYNLARQTWRQELEGFQKGGKAA